MPVNLDAIPDVAPRIRRPSTPRWLYVLASILVAGNVLTFWLWEGERTGYDFWLAASVFPFCSWGLLFSIRRFGYKCDQVWAAAWDSERALLLEQETTRGQRSAWILNNGIITQLGTGLAKLLTAIKSADSQLNVQITRAGGKPVRHSRLPGFHDQQQSQDLEEAVKTLVGQLKPVLAEIRVSVPCWLMVDCHIPGVPDADDHIVNVLTLLTDRTFHLLPSKGLTAFDYWLDEAWEQPAVLLAISAEIRATPREDEGEALAWTLLLNRDHAAFPTAVRLHRPEKGNIAALSTTLSRALLWSKTPAERVKGSWTTGKALAQGGEWSCAVEGNGLTFSMTEDNQDVDQTTGYTGKAAPWLAVNLAATLARQGGSQVAAVETDTDEIWVVGITPGNPS
jgi:hypothetical protein